MCSSLQVLSSSEKARLTTMLVDQRALGVSRPVVTNQMIEDARRRQNLPIYQRAERLLQFFVERTPTIGISHTIVTRGEFQWSAMAWSESVEMREVFSLDEYLEQNGWIGTVGRGSNVKVLVDGYSRVADLRTNLDSSQAFIAMWINDETNEVYRSGLKPAIEDAGYNPLRIDEKPDLNKTDDEIITEIRRSRFLVADFTHGADGARGSVYFEAGFAYGLDIQVIHTCHSDLVDKLHFDIRQYNHVLWKESSFEEFRKSLRARIMARIGTGPNVNMST